MSNYYEILGVPRSAGSAEIRKAYLQLARDRHPDRFTDPVEKQRAHDFFAEMTTAFNTLTNEANRREYDQGIDRPVPQSPSEIAADAYTRGLASAEAGQYEDALTLLQTAVHHAPEDARYHAALGQFLGKLKGKERDAIQSLERASQMAPTVAQHHADLAILFDRLGLRLRSQRAIEAALRLAPRDAQVRRIASQLGLS
jgi:curved DNA-binding protein CbpA